MPTFNQLVKQGRKDKSYKSKGISEPGYSGEWKLVYPKNIKQMKNGEIENATI